MKGEILIPKAWRSELTLIALFLISGAVSVGLSNSLPDSIIYGPLFESSKGHGLYLGLPLFWLIPLSFACWVLIRIFDVRYSLRSMEIQAVKGRISLNQKISKVRYEDIRSLEVRQRLIGRILNYGDVLIGTAGTSDIEVTIEGVYAPREIQDMIQRERKLETGKTKEEEPKQIEADAGERKAIGSE